MTYITKILLGTITKTSGFEGEVTVKLDKTITGNIPEMESVFLEIEGRPVPFFISGSDYPGAGSLKLQFDGYNSSDKVREFIGCRVFLTSEIKAAEHSPDDHGDLTGYTVFDKNGDLAGIVSDVIRNPGQLLLTVVSPLDEEILIPLHEDFIVSIDPVKRSVIMAIPDGLKDINR